MNQIDLIVEMLKDLKAKNAELSQNLASLQKDYHEVVKSLASLQSNNNTAAQQAQASGSTLSAQSQTNAAASKSQSETKITKFSDIPQPRASRVKEILESGKKVTNEGDVSKFEETPKNLRDITISSLEIAELTGKNHRDVTRDIEEQLGQIYDDGGVRKFAHTYQNPQNKQFYKCYQLPKREALILVSGYNVKLRAKIIDRLEYLENQMLDKILSQTPQQNSIDESLKRYEALFGGKFSVQTPCKQFIMQNIAQAEAKHNAIATELVSYNYTEEFKKGKANITSRIGLVYDRPVSIDKKPIITKGYLSNELLRENQSSITANAESKSRIRKR